MTTVKELYDALGKAILEGKQSETVCADNISEGVDLYIEHDEDANLIATLDYIE